jgi:hypothetical protein
VTERLPDKLENNARVEIRINGVTVGTRRIVDFIDDSATMTGTDDGGLYDVVTLTLPTGGGASTTQVVTIQVSDFVNELLTGDGQAMYRIPALIDTWNLTAVAAAVAAASSSGTVTVQVRNATAATDMLSTALTVDVSEVDSITAATPAVIDTGADDVNTADHLFIDVDGAGNDVLGLQVELVFEAP